MNFIGWCHGNDKRQNFFFVGCLSINLRKLLLFWNFFYLCFLDFCFFIFIYKGIWDSSVNAIQEEWAASLQNLWELNVFCFLFVFLYFCIFVFVFCFCFFFVFLFIFCFLVSILIDRFSAFLLFVSYS